MAKNDISSVYIEVVVNADGTVKPMSAAQKAFFNFRKETSKHRGLGKSIAADMGKMAVGLFGVHKAIQLASSATRTFFRDVSAFQRMSVELKVATGSALKGERAFAQLQQVAKVLPTSLQDLTTGFVRLKNMGLDASNNSLISFSNTAAAMGKSLKQFVEAVADANTREFERLKEFGILARNQGATIRVTFRGMTKDIENSSKDIVGYLTDIGNTEFAGAATEQIGTLSSRMTKLKDALFNFNVELGKTSEGFMGETIASVTSKFEELTTMMQGRDIFDSIVDPFIKGNVSLEEFQENLSNLATKDIDGLKSIRGRLEKILGPFKYDETPFETFYRMFDLGTGGQATLDARNNRAKQALKEMSRSSQILAKTSVEEADAAEKKAKADQDSTDADAKKQSFLLARKKFSELDVELSLQEAIQARDLNTLETHRLRLLEQQAKLAQDRANQEGVGVFSPEAMDNTVKSIGENQKALSSLNSLIKEINEEQSQAEKDLAHDRAMYFAEIDLAQRKITAWQQKNAREKSLQLDLEQAKARMIHDVELENLLATAEGIQLRDALIYKQTLLNQKLEEARKSFKGALNKEQAAEFAEQISGILSELASVNQEAEDLDNNVSSFGKQMQQTFDDIKEGIADAIVEGENFKGVLASILKQIAKTSIIGALTGAFPGLGTPLKTAFNGGPVTANRPFLVGERGPELFVPSNSGSITPNHRTGGGARTVNVVNNFSIDGGDKREMQQMIASSVSASVGLAVNKMQDNKRRGIR